MSDFEKLRWIRIFTPDHIPVYLLEQIKHREYDLDEFYKYHRLSAVEHSPTQIKLNPFSHLYVLADEKNIVKGYTWFSIEPLTKNIFINIFSIDKEYWNNGKAVKKLTDLILPIKEKAHLRKILWATRYPKHSLRHGFHRCEDVLMEYNPDKVKEEEKNGKNIDGLGEPRGKCSNADTTATKLSELSTGRSDSGKRSKRSREISKTV